MAREYMKVLHEQARQRARVRYIEDKAHTLVPLTFSRTRNWDDALALAVDLAGRLFDKLPEMPTEDDDSEPPIAASERCPKCDSPDPGRHPAMQLGGEVQTCSHAFHGAEQ